MDTLSREERSERMRRVRSSNTKPELELRTLVWGLGYRYRTNRRDLIGHPDIAFIGRKRSIFLHGCFWHRHDCINGQRAPKSKRAFWRAKFKKNVERDIRVMRQIRAAGWRALVIWECELLDRSKVARRIERFLDA
jgi:DNA mismatch endonuclease (patch repair protein)